MWLVGSVILASFSFASGQEALQRLQPLDNGASESPALSGPTRVFSKAHGQSLGTSTTGDLFGSWTIQPGLPLLVSASEPSTAQSKYDLKQKSPATTTSAASLSRVTNLSSAELARDSTPGNSYFRIMADGGSLHGKRQASAAYVDGDGTISNDCANAPIYQIQNGSLIAVVNEVPYYYSTNPGVSIQLMVPSLTRSGSVNTTFTLGSGGTLLWSNPAFDNGAATFCSATNGSIYAVFERSARPANCLEVQLRLFTVSSCAGRLFPVSTLVSTLVSSVERTLVSTLERTLLSTVERSLVSTLERTSTQPASTLVSTLERTTTQAASTLVSTLERTTTQPASTFVSTLERTTTQPASTLVTTLERTTTQPGQSQTIWPPPSACSNQGMSWAAFNNPFTFSTGAYTVYRPTYVKTSVGPPAATGGWSYRYATGITSSLGGGLNGAVYCANNRFVLPPAYTINEPATYNTNWACTQYSMLFRGYFYIYMTGYWTFTVTTVDDAAFFWIGDQARYAWDGTNAVSSAIFTWPNVNGQNTSLPVYLTGNTYIPIRVLYAQGVGAQLYQVRITAHDGQVYTSTDDSATGSPLLVQYVCGRPSGFGPYNATNWGYEL